MKLLLIFTLICFSIIGCKRKCVTYSTVFPYKTEAPKEGNVNEPIKFTIDYQIASGDQITDVDLIENNFEKTLLFYTINENCSGTADVLHGTYEKTIVFKKPGTYYIRYPRGYGGSLYSEEDDLIDTLVIYE